MTKEITKAFILQQMQNKFAMREFESRPFLFDETVVPVYNIEQHLEEWWQRFATKTITTTGAALFFTTPDERKWTLKRYDVVFMTGVFTIAGVYIVRTNMGSENSFVYLDLKAAQNASYHIERDVTLNPGDKIYVNVDGYTSTGDLRIYLDYKEEYMR